MRSTPRLGISKCILALVPETPKYISRLRIVTSASVQVSLNQISPESIVPTSSTDNSISVVDLKDSLPEMPESKSSDIDQDVTSTFEEQATSTENNENEEWRPCRNYLNYWVSSLGRLATPVGYLSGASPREYDGYTLVSVRPAGGRKKMTLLHILVATAFHPNPENKPQVNHIDCNPRNNKASNLEWVTPKENSNRQGPVRKERQGRPVIHFNLNDGFIRVWDRIMDATATLKLAEDCIVKCCSENQN